MYPSCHHVVTTAHPDALITVDVNAYGLLTMPPCCLNQQLCWTKLSITVCTNVGKVGKVAVGRTSKQGAVRTMHPVKRNHPGHRAGQDITLYLIRPSNACTLGLYPVSAHATGKRSRSLAA